MKRFLKKLSYYLKGLGFGLSQLKLPDLLKLLANSQEVIKPLEPYNFSLILNIHDRAIGRPILLKSSYEEVVTQALKPFLKADTHFLDIGANIGYYSFLVASQCPQGKVFSFEPDCTNFRLFKTGIVYNGFEHIIQPYQMAVSDVNESVLIFDLGQKNNSGARLTSRDEQAFHLYQAAKKPTPSTYQTVTAVRLDDFLANTRVDLVKLDIEGHEPLALRGMMALLRQNQPIIFTEFAPISLGQIGKTTPEEFLQLFIDLGYQLNILADDGRLIACQQNIPAVMENFAAIRKNHIDLLLTIAAEESVG